MTDKSHILEVHPERLAEWLQERGQPSYRLDQVLDWIYERYAGSFEEMSNLPKELRAELEGCFLLGGTEVADRQLSGDGETEKFLFLLPDGEQVESVAMGTEGAYTFCISSQTGCPLGCLFCATGRVGAGRDLSAAEILGQVLALARSRGQLGNIVFMGMGEPLLNLEALLPALEALLDERRFALGTRRVTVSTAGIPDGIRRLADSGLRPCLALSLNSPFQDQRSEIMPVSRRHPLEVVLGACEYYAARTGRRLMLEYVLLGGLNTSRAAAHQVATIAHRLEAIVNLIAFNPLRESELQKPTRDEVREFRQVLEGRGVTVTERYRRGRDISAGCGQLRAGKED